MAFMSSCSLTTCLDCTADNKLVDNADNSSLVPLDPKTYNHDSQYKLSLWYIN